MGLAPTSFLSAAEADARADADTSSSCDITSPEGHTTVTATAAAQGSGRDATTLCVDFASLAAQEEAGPTYACDPTSRDVKMAHACGAENYLTRMELATEQRGAAKHSASRRRHRSNMGEPQRARRLPGMHDDALI